MLRLTKTKAIESLFYVRHDRFLSLKWSVSHSIHQLKDTSIKVRQIYGFFPYLKALAAQQDVLFCVVHPKAEGNVCVSCGLLS